MTKAYLEIVKALGEILPCPFCGSKNIEVIKVPDYSAKFLVKCSDCLVRLPEIWQKGKAIEAWNTRVSYETKDRPGK